MPGFSIQEVAPNVYHTYRTGTIMVDRFMVHVEDMCEKYGIELYLTDAERVTYGGIECTGFFDPRLKRLALAMGGHQHGGGPSIAPWLPTLAHEFAHMTQWIDKCDAWTTMFFDEHGLIDSEMVIGLWIEHQCELNEEQLQRHLSAARGVEVDCEHRTLKLIEEFDLPIDPETYARAGNAYAYFWTTIKDTREWYMNRPYEQDKVLALMPTEMRENDFYDDIPPNVRELIVDLCYDKAVTEEEN